MTTPAIPELGDPDRRPDRLDLEEADALDRRLRRRFIGWVAVGGAVVVLGIVGTFWGLAVWDRVGENDDQLGVLATNLDATRQQVRDLCAISPDLDDSSEACQPVAPPAEDLVEGTTAETPVRDAIEAERGPRGEQGETGEPGPTGPAPSASQVQAAVSRYCGANDCSGPEGPGPSATQVATAVATYCNARGECQGPEGAAGEEGAQGAPGETGETGAAGPEGETGAQGPPGPGPTSEQVSAAVASFCEANNGCRGAPGPQGETGPAGPQGETGPAGPTCPGGATPIAWTVDAARAATTGLEPGTYLVCPAAVG